MSPRRSAVSFHWWVRPLHTGWIDDEELGEIQELLWRGYRPAPYPRTPEYERHVWRASLDFDHQYRRWKKNHDQQAALRQQEKMQRIKEHIDREVIRIEQQHLLDNFKRKFDLTIAGHYYVCGRCGKRRWSPSSEEEADAEFREVFGEAAFVNRVAVCEPCYDILMAERGSDA
jgi:hypothetical protein